MCGVTISTGLLLGAPKCYLSLRGEMWCRIVVSDLQYLVILSPGTVSTPMIWQSKMAAAHPIVNRRPAFRSPLSIGDLAVSNPQV